MTLVIQGAHEDGVSDEGGQQTHYSAGFMSDGMQYHVDYVCPFNGTGGGSYDADKSSVKFRSIHTNADGSNPLPEIVTFERH